MSPFPHFSLVTELFLQMNSCLKDKIKKTGTMELREEDKMELMTDKSISSGLSLASNPVYWGSRHVVLVPFAPNIL